MSQLSQYSEGGLSDIIPDVETFIQEHGISEDVGHLLAEIPHEAVVKEETLYKQSAVEAFTSPNQMVFAMELQFPPAEPQNLSTDEYPGPFNFEVLIIPNEQKTPWEYSPKLNKIFIGINLKFPVAFSIENRPTKLNLFIRATPIFTQSQFFQEPVHRCVGHQHPADPSNKGLPAHIYQHIMRCSNNAAKYFGSRSDNTRLNVVVPLGNPQTGSDVVKEFYHFVCKNSCPLGMNRRPIDVVFTLEDEDGEVYGRKFVSVRVCSCPKRDREKEEKDAERCTPQPGKRRRVAGGSRRRDCEDDVDTTVYPLSINIIGKNNYLDMLRFGRDRMANESRKTGGATVFEKSYDEWCNLIDKTGAD